MAPRAPVTSALVPPTLDQEPAAGRTIRAVGDGLLSALPEGDEGAPNDARAAAYDRLIGNPLYNRVMWGTSPAAYTAFAWRAVASGSGPMLDAGSGTAVFTGALYRESRRPVVLVDRSLAMLQRARTRASRDGATFVQADLFDLPFAAAGFATVACFGVLHVVGDMARALASLRAQVAPGGRLFVSALVAETAVGRTYLRLLHRLGEVVAPFSEAELAAAVRRELGSGATVRRQGSMVFVEAAG